MFPPMHLVNALIFYFILFCGSRDSYNFFCGGCHSAHYKSVPGPLSQWVLDPLELDLQKLFWGLWIRTAEAVEWIEYVNSGKSIKVKWWRKVLQVNRSRKGWAHCSPTIHQKIDFKTKFVRKWVWRDDTEVKSVYCSLENWSSVPRTHVR